MFISTRNTPNITILQRIYYEYYDEKYLHHSIPPNFRAPIISTHPLSLSPLWSILHIPKFGRKIQFRLINSPCMSLSLSLSTLEISTENWLRPGYNIIILTKYFSLQVYCPGSGQVWVRHDDGQVQAGDRAGQTRCQVIWSSYLRNTVYCSVECKPFYWSEIKFKHNKILEICISKICLYNVGWIKETIYWYWITRSLEITSVIWHYSSTVSTLQHCYWQRLETSSKIATAW